MKKVLSFICILSVLFSLLAYSIAFAEDINELSISDVSVKAGEEASVILSSNSNSSIAGLECKISYNSEVMELISVTPQSDIFPISSFQGGESIATNPYYLSWDSSLEGGKQAIGKLAVLKFKIKEEAAAGEYEVTPIILNGGIFDDNLNDVDFSTVSGKITVAGSSVKPTIPTNPGDEKGVLNLTADDVEFSGGLYWNLTQTKGSSELGYLMKMTSTTFNANDKFFGIKFNQKVFDVNPVKMELTLRSEGDNYTYYHSWFSDSMSRLQANPAIASEEKVKINDNTWNQITASGSKITVDFTEDANKGIIDNNYLYFYICAGRANSNVTAMYIDSVKVYYNESVAVIIDGVEHYAQNNQFTFPETADLYISENAVYKSGETINVENNINVTSYSLNLKMKQGVSIRLKDSGSGIRFATDVDLGVMEELKSIVGIEVAQGTLISPKDLVGEKELTFESDFKTANVQYTGELGALYNPDGFVGSLVKIIDNNITREFMGRGYVTVKMGNSEKTVYADNYKTTSRSVAMVAYVFKTTENSDYINLSNRQKMFVDKWAGLYVVPDRKDPCLPDKF